MFPITILHRIMRVWATVGCISASWFHVEQMAEKRRAADFSQYSNIQVRCNNYSEFFIFLSLKTLLVSEIVLHLRHPIINCSILN